MKPICIALLLMLPVSTPALAQSTPHESTAAAAPSDAQAGFDKIKSLAGTWVGSLTTSPQEPSVEGKLAQFTLREASLGNSLVHEFSVSGLPDHPITLFYLEEDRLTLTHYCDAGNRPRMVGKVSPDGNKVAFELLDLSGGDRHGHMHSAVFTFIDENHHIEEWTYMMPGDKPVRARFDLQRTNAGGDAAAR